MRSEIVPDGQARSFIDRARRAQIIECTIDVIAERGFGGASLSEIARQAGVSKGVISYHFAGKNELIQQVVKSVYSEAITLIFEAMEREATAAGKLRVYIRANLDYFRNHRRRMLAMVEVFTNFRREDGSLFYDVSYNEELWQTLAAICDNGQASGEFRAFDSRVMAIAIQAALDSVLVMQPSHPETDLDAYTRELIDLFEWAMGARAVKPGTEQEG